MTARPSPSGSGTLRLRVAGLTLAVRAPRGSSLLNPPAIYTPFLARRGADIELTLVEEPPPRLAQGSAWLFESGGVWRVGRHGSGRLYEFRSRACDPPVYKAVAIDEALTRGQLFFPPRCGRGPRFALDFPLDELLFQHRLAREGHLETHACGLVVTGRAILLCGRSGAGKSTSARLWQRWRPGTPILSDDRVVLRRDGPRLTAHGTPWHGDARCARPDARPLAAVFFLRHGRRSAPHRLRPPEAAAQLFARSFPPVWDEAVVARALEACCAVAERVPCYGFPFRPDRSAVEAVLATVRA